MRVKILITGSNGMLGCDLVKTLGGRHEIAGLAKTTLGKVSSINFFKVNIANEAEVEKAISAIRPDLIIHAAAYTHVDHGEINRDEALRVNVEGTKNIARVAKELDSAVIYVSTDYVFDGTKKGPYKEDDVANPISFYGKTKLMGEEAVSSMLKKFVIVRTSWLFGKNGKNFVKTIFKVASKKDTLEVVNDQRGRPTYTADLAKAILKIVDTLENEKKQDSIYGRIFHIANRGETSWYDFAKEILNLAGKKDIKIVPVSSEKLARPAKRPKNSVLDTGLFEETFNETLPSWKEALRNFLGDINLI